MLNEEQKQYWEDKIRTQAKNEPYNRLSPILIETMVNWVCHKLHPGGFVTAVLSNDLFEACGRADTQNSAQLDLICRFIYNNIPRGCYGSHKAMENWRDE